MKRFSFAAVLLAVVSLSTALQADSPHFLYANSSISNTTGSLTVSFKETGLGTGTTSVSISLSANATATYQCWNTGGNHPKAGNKESFQSTVTASGEFAVRNGQTTGDLSVGPPVDPNFSCPNGQGLYLMGVTYSGINVTDAFGESLAATPDPISTGDIMILITGPNH